MAVIHRIIIDYYFWYFRNFIGIKSWGKLCRNRLKCDIYIIKITVKDWLVTSVETHII